MLHFLASTFYWFKLMKNRLELKRISYGFLFWPSFFQKEVGIENTISWRQFTSWRNSTKRPAWLLKSDFIFLRESCRFKPLFPTFFTFSGWLKPTNKTKQQKSKKMDSEIRTRNLSVFYDITAGLSGISSTAAINQEQQHRIMFRLTIVFSILASIRQFCLSRHWNIQSFFYFYI